MEHNEGYNTEGVIMDDNTLLDDEIVIIEADKVAIVNNEIGEIIDVEPIELTDEDKEPHDISDDINLLKNLQKFSDIENLEKTRESIKSGLSGIVSDEDAMDKLWERVSSIGLGVLKAMPLRAIDEIFMSCGVDITDDENQINYGEGKEHATEFNKQEFRKDLLIFVKEMEIADAEYEKSLDEFKADVAELDEEIKSALGEYDGSVDKFITTKVDELMANITESSSERDKEFLTWYQYGLTLEPIIEYVNSYKGKSILHEYLIDNESRKTYDKNVRMRELVNCSTQFEKYSSVVKKELFPELSETPNEETGKEYVSLFAIISYIANLNKNRLEEKDFKNISLFLNSLALNLTRMSTGKLAEDDKLTLLNSLRTIHKTIVD